MNRVNVAVAWSFSTWEPFAVPLSFWMFTRRAPGHGVLNTA